MAKQPKRKGGSSQDRRRARRAADRAPVLNSAPALTASVLPEHEPVVCDLVNDPTDVFGLSEHDFDVTSLDISPERAALAALEAQFAPTAPCADCDHAATAHMGDDNMGACTYEDDEGVCSCTGYTTAAPSDGDGDEMASEATVRIVIPDDAINEAAALMVARAQVSLAGEEVPVGDAAMPEVLQRFQAHLEAFEVELLEAFDAVALPDEMAPGEQLPAPNESVSMPEPQELAGRGPIAWTANFVPEATLTDDGRAFAPDSISWRELPLSLSAMLETAEGHDGATVCGRIDTMWRDGNMIKASGVFDTGDYGQEIARMVSDGTLRGVSVDIAIHEYEIGPRSQWFDDQGEWAPQEQTGEQPTLEEVLFDQAAERQILLVTKAVIGMSTICPFPAFAGASISLAASGAPLWTVQMQGGFVLVQQPEPLVASAGVEGGCLCEGEHVCHLDPIQVQGMQGEALTASALGLVPTAPPSDWFTDPGLDELTPLTITDDGRIYGHAWAWESCHLAYRECVTAPHTAAAYAYFHLGELECDSGDRVAVGKVTLDAPHASQHLGRADATAHYDHTGTVAAHVVCGEDEFGGWVAGAVSPDLTEEKLRLLRGSVLSGDWRDVNGNLELVALLAVNVPGFPVPRTRALLAAGTDGTDRVIALVAAGITRVAATSPLVSDEARAKLAALAAAVDLAEHRSVMLREAEAATLRAFAIRVGAR